MRGIIFHSPSQAVTHVCCRLYFKLVQHFRIIVATILCVSYTNFPRSLDKSVLQKMEFEYSLSSLPAAVAHPLGRITSNINKSSQLTFWRRVLIYYSLVKLIGYSSVFSCIFSFSYIFPNVASFCLIYVLIICFSFFQSHFCFSDE